MLLGIDDDDDDEPRYDVTEFRRLLPNPVVITIVDGEDAEDTVPVKLLLLLLSLPLVDDFDL